MGLHPKVPLLPSFALFGEHVVHSGGLSVDVHLPGEPFNPLRRGCVPLNTPILGAQKGYLALVCIFRMAIWPI